MSSRKEKKISSRLLQPNDVNSGEKLAVYLLQNWLRINSVNGDENVVGKFNFNMGGCNPIALEGRNRYVLCVHDYKKLWNFYSLAPPTADNCNSFGSYALLFESCVLFLFEQRTVVCLKWVNIWNTFVLLVIAIVQPSTLFGNATSLVSFWGFYWVYVSCCRVYKASVGDGMLTIYALGKESQVRNSVYSKAAVQKSLDLYSHSSDFSLFKVWMFLNESLTLELLEMMGYSTEYMVAEQEDSSYQTDIESNGANAAMGNAFETAANGAEDNKSFFGSVRVKPLPSSTSSKDKYDCDQLKTDATQCCECAYFLLLNVGAKFLSSHTQSKVVVSKFGRNILLTALVSMPILYLYNFTVFFLGYTCAVPNSYNQNPWFVGLNCTSQYILVYATLGTFTMFIVYLGTTVCLMVSVIGMLYGAIILHGLATCWVGRFAGLRRVPLLGRKARNHDFFHDQVSKFHQESMYNQQSESVTMTEPFHIDQDDVEDEDDDMMYIDNVSQVSRNRLSARIKRDAYEHYLFIQEYVRQASALWSPVIFGISFMSLLIFCLTMFGLVSNSDSFGALIGYLILLVIFVSIGTFPIYCLAYANAAVDTIRESFIYQSSPADFAVLGGRDQWVYYLNQSPAYWTVFGYPITWTVLYGVMGSVVGSMIVAISTVAVSLSRN